MTDISAFGFADDVEFARYLVKDVGVATVPGSSFYKNRATGRTKLRFCFCKRDETLQEADRRLRSSCRRASRCTSAPDASARRITRRKYSSSADLVFFVSRYLSTGPPPRRRYPST